MKSENSNTCRVTHSGFREGNVMIFFNSIITLVHISRIKLQLQQNIRHITQSLEYSVRHTNHFTQPQNVSQSIGEILKKLPQGKKKSQNT